MTHERVHPPKEQKTSLSADVRDLFRNRPWVVLCVVGIAALTYANIRGTVIIYYFDYVVPNGKEYFSSVMTTGAMAFIAGVMVTSPLSKRFGKRNFYMVSMTLTAILTVGFYYVPPANIPLVWGAHALISFCAAPTAPRSARTDPRRPTPPTRTRRPARCSPKRSSSRGSRAAPRPRPGSAS